MKAFADIHRVHTAATVAMRTQATPTPPTFEDCKIDVTEEQWSMIIRPLLGAIQVVCGWIEPLSKTDSMYTLPTSMFVGTRSHKVLAVPRRVYDASEQIRSSMLSCLEKNFPVELLERYEVTHIDPKGSCLVIAYRYFIYLEDPKLGG